MQHQFHLGDSNFGRGDDAALTDSHGMQSALDVCQINV
jgi:hypothetical protein